MEQLTFFNIKSDSWETRVNNLLDQIIKERGLPNNSLILKEQIDNVNSGEHIILICEPEYPFDEKLANSITESPMGITIKYLLRLIIFLKTELLRYLNMKNLSWFLMNFLILSIIMKQTMQLIFRKKHFALQATLNTGKEKRLNNF